MIKAIIAATSLALFATACSDQFDADVEVRQGASTVIWGQYILVPAYFVNSAPTSDYSWYSIQEFNDPDPDTGSETVFYAIVNENSGPGAGFDQALQDKITYLSSQLIDVF